MRRSAPSSAGRRGCWRVSQPSAQAASTRPTPPGAPPPPAPGPSTPAIRAGPRAAPTSPSAMPQPARPPAIVRGRAGPSAGRSGPGTRRRPGWRAWRSPGARAARASTCGWRASIAAATTPSPAPSSPGCWVPGGLRHSPAVLTSPGTRRWAGGGAGAQGCRPQLARRGPDGDLARARGAQAGGWGGCGGARRPSQGRGDRARPGELRAGAPGRQRGRGGHERPQASRGGGLSDSCESSSSLRAGARRSRSACHQPMSRRGRLSSPSGRNITVRIRMAP